MTGEFDMIARYFLPLSMGRAEVFNYQNDTAQISVKAGCDLVVSTDTLHEGLHFFAGTPPDIIAQKALRSNLSDIAASGAAPHSYQLALSLPPHIAQDETWLSKFASALLSDQKEAGLYCSGGDTTRSPHDGISITITLLGHVPSGRVITRSGAQAGNAVVVAGIIGHGAAAFMQGKTIAPPLNKHVGDIVQKYASAAVDVSDGLLADAGHIAASSDVQIWLDEDAVPTPKDADFNKAITGGDDYVVVMTVASDQVKPCQDDFAAIGIKAAVIGDVRDGDAGMYSMKTQQNFNQLTKKAGWQHF